LRISKGDISGIMLMTPIILHRKEIKEGKPPFHALGDATLRTQFDEEVLGILNNFDYTVFTVIIDKLEHLEQYHRWHYDPYHYCMEVLLERYVLWLEERDSMGDVLAESRGGKEDRRLKDSFARHSQMGTRYLTAERITQRLTSNQLKVKSKSNNISGLQLTDLVAYPSFRSTLARHQNQSLADNFSMKIAQILEEHKYYRSSTGRIWGWGRKWLP
ncbi:MAG TPA: DUF3800 domain-containing protein, partial [bacterium]|jgi:hypothetical protein